LDGWSLPASGLAICWISIQYSGVAGAKRIPLIK
jgi:hypothetical protein